eukprot:TRINITY_DN80378_c0_g1_i1.p1 TRINITY_DN80378_c0_g1~~TRINITY_DN80378_c0_g1_i1.p1  ORF type:complete len:665 (-),score=139.36 TRINITY_DN80378_c0_g1_i1:140-2134(-)
MCGIFAYLGDRQAVQLLITALKRLEYRGYDSAGVGIYGSPQLKLRKKVGKVSCLESECSNGNTLEGTVGIAHTRWATHGKPSDVNSHPHTTGDKSIAVVHNGIIENFRSLRKELSDKGYVFVSETDTELLAHLVQDIRTTMPASEFSWTEVVATALKLVEGAYAVVFLFEGEPDLLVGARKGSPMILGVGSGEYMLASDASAIIEHTKDVVYMRDGEMVEIRRNGYQLFTAADLQDKVSKNLGPVGNVKNPIVRLEMSLEQIEKGGYAHFMLKEIMDQPNALRNAMRGRLVEKPDGSWQVKLGGLEKALGLDKDEGAPTDGSSPGARSRTISNDDLTSAMSRMSDADRIIIAACGTSWHSGLIAKCVIEGLAEIPVEVEYASEFRYRRPLLCPEDVIIAISQSGETADTLEAVRIGQAFKALTIGVVNGVGSSIARLTEAGTYLHAGPEIGVASTKAFTGQVITLTMIGLQLAAYRKTLSQAQVDEYCTALSDVPKLIEDWLEPLNAQVKLMAKYFRLATNVLFCGCGVHFPVALEGALKLKEISYIHAEGFPAAEIKHGPLTLIRGFVPVVVIAMRSDPAYRQIQANLKDLRSKDAALIVITDEGNEDFARVASFVIHCPQTKMHLEPLIAVVPLQLLSYHIADMRGCSIDQPRNLAKSVTVE